MRVRQISLGIRGACALLAAVGVMLFAVAEAEAVDTAAINAKVAAALAAAVLGSTTCRICCARARLR